MSEPPSETKRVTMLIVDIALAEIVSSSIAIAALGVAIWSRLGVRRDARRSAEAAERSAEAAERADRRATLAEARAAVHWRVTPSDFETSELVNDGPAAAHMVSVVLSPRGGTGTPVVWGEWPLVLRGAAIPEPLTLDGRARDRWVEVSWQLVPDGDELRLSERLPF